MKISLYVCFCMKIIPWRFGIFNPNSSWVIHSFCIFLKKYATFKRILLFLYVCKQVFRKCYGWITLEFLGLKMRNIQGTAFIWTETYRKIYKSALANQSNISSNITYLPCWMKCWNGLRNYKIWEVSKKKKKIMLHDVG